MYDNPFIIDKPIGNNSFSFGKRANREIYVPSIIEGDFIDVEIGDKPAFIEFDEDGNEKIFFGLKNFVKISWCDIPVYVFDNHNHAFYFWYEFAHERKISEPLSLVHIDEHHDTREPPQYLESGNDADLMKIFEYTNFTLNVGNYIIPAVRSGLISEVFSITGETDLINCTVSGIKGNYILNLDLDFFSPELDYIDFELKRNKILDFAKNASLITISTSPYFIDQDLAIGIMNRLFR
ncbi:MAG: UPF0489 family protein [Candidatus Gracilibacteria bacterium]|nr:UPF0489 family protein [Candidatus Gracilibacteria bacterium]